METKRRRDEERSQKNIVKRKVINALGAVLAPELLPSPTDMWKPEPE